MLIHARVSSDFTAVSTLDGGKRDDVPPQPISEFKTEN
jgi:hypothetical protein